MFENFRSLPPFVRIASVVVGLGVIVGILVIIVAYAAGGASKPSPTKTPPGGGPNPSISITATPGSTPTPSATPTPNRSAQDEQNRVNDTGTSSKQITDQDRLEITNVAEDGYTAWCTHDSHSAKGSTAIEDKYFAKLPKYFAPGSSQLERGNYISFIQDQVCEVHAGQPSKVLTADTVTYVLFASVATVYEDGTPGHTGNKAYVSNPAANLTLQKINGKWMIIKLVTEGSSD